MISLRSIILALLLAVLACAPVRAQTFTIADGSGSGCSGVLYDSGDEGANGYQNNEDYTFTLCPDIPGNVIYLTFFNFNLDVTGPGLDYLTIYDGDNTSAGTLGSYSGTQLQNIIVSASVFNTSGCLTLVFHSNAVGTGVFAAGFQCTTPCEHPVAAAVMSEPMPARVCVDEPVVFNGSASAAAPGFTITQYLWDFDDGTVDSTSGPVVSHAFEHAGEHVVQLTITDDNECESLNLIDQQVLVGTTPTFGRTSPSVEVCFGETVELFGHADPVTWTGMPDANFGDGIFLPDDVGLPFRSELTFEQFGFGQQVTGTDDILSICVDMEHTYMGDLVLQVICPNGQTTIFHQQGGGGTYLGAANDNDDDDDPVAGECWHYCWSPTANNGTWIENLTNTTVAGTPPSAALDPGTYESVQPFSNLIGCPLNGTWTFQSSDLWGIDNGFICGWEIDFDPSLIPDVTEFTPTIGPDADSSRWAGGTPPDHLSANGDTLRFTATAPGVYDFIYTVTDNFGCDFDTTVQVTVDDPIEVDAGPDAVVCDDPVQLNATIASAPASCVWVLNMQDSYGDGWNGARVRVFINGVPTNHTIQNGSENIVNIAVNAGDEIRLVFVSGNYDDEVSYTFIDDQGNVVYSDGPYPTTGPVWIGTATCGGMGAMVWEWMPTTGLSDPHIANPTAQITQTTMYTVTAHIAGHPACRASDQVTVMLDPGADPGTDSLIVICPSHPSFALFDMLGGTPASGGAWTDAGGGTAAATFDPGIDAAGVFTYTVTSALGCIGAAQVEVQVLPANDPQCCMPLDPGVSSTLTLCASDGATPLFPQLGGTPDVGGTWTRPDGTAFDGTFVPGTDAPGDHTYTVASGPTCPPASAIISVVVVMPVSAGTDGSIALCASGTVTDLMAVLGGVPQPGGAWTAPDGTASDGLFTPGASQDGSYTYAVAGNAPCPGATAQVVVATVQPPDAGTDGSLSICANGMALELVNSLDGAPAPFGQWTDPLGLPNVGLFDPAVDQPGDYTYTITGTVPCPDASSTVTVTVVAPPDAGTDGALLLCVSSAPTDLFMHLGGTPDGGGSWSFNGTPHAPLFDPLIDVPGDLVYTVEGVAPCPSASALVAVSVVSPPDPGTDGALTVCTSGTPIDLFAQLGGAPATGGDWSGPSNVSDGLFDPTAMEAGGYSYTLQASAPCPIVSSTVTITLATPPDAGLDAPLALCATSQATDLFGALGGAPDAGGTWMGPTGLPHGASFDPASDVPGDHTYTVTGPAPCPAATAVVTVVVVTDPDAGIDGAITLCTSAASIGLFAQLGGTPDIGGTWSGPSAVTGDVFDPATMAAGVYIYSIDVPPPCIGVSSTVTVTTVTPPDAGTDGTLPLCISSPSTELLSVLGGTPVTTGTWIAPDGTAHGPSFDPAFDASGTYTYTVMGTAACPSASAMATIVVVTDPDPGIDGAVVLCMSDAPIALFAQLDGTPDAGGNWTGPSAVIDGAFDPATMTAGVYTYRIDVPPPCVSVSSTVTVVTVAPPDPGSDATLALCLTASPMDLFTVLGGTPEATGTWTAPDGVAHAGVFDPAVDGIGTYTYRVEGTAPCPAASAAVMLNVVAPPDAGADGTLVLCITGAAVDLNAQLSGADPGGTWTDPSGQAFNGVFLPGSDLPGGYTYTVPGTSPCVSDAAVITVDVQHDPDAGDDAAITLCAQGVPQDLFTSLQGTPGTGGQWIAPSGAASTGVIDPAVDVAGTYSYVLTVPPPCVNDTARVIVSVVQPPDAGTDGSLSLCADGAKALLFDALGGTPDAGGGWTLPNGSTGDGSVDPTVDEAGVYTYTVPGTAPCPDMRSTVIVAIGRPIVGTVVTSDAVCNGYCNGTAMLGVSGGMPTFSYAWTNGIAGPSDTAAIGLCAGTYAVSITDADGCTGSAQFAIGEPPPLVIDQVSAVDETCVGACDGAITVHDPQGVRYSADEGSTWQVSPLLTDLCAETYVLLMQDADGCQASAVAVVGSPLPVIADFIGSPDTVTVESPAVTLTNLSERATSFAWDLAGLGTSTEVHPSFVLPDVPGEYPVCLTARNEVGCVDSICRSIIVLDVVVVHIPNAFTPEGDGINEGFAPVFNLPQAVADYTLRIYDRWGEVVFETHALNDPWTGTVRSAGASSVKQDVYVWKLEFRDVHAKQVHERMGSVTLLR